MATMKNTSTILSFLGLFCIIYGFVEEEAITGICKIPSEYARRITNCTLSRSSKGIVELTDGIFRCVLKSYSYKTKDFSVYKYICSTKVKMNIKVRNCMDALPKNILQLSEEDENDLSENFKFCVINA
ncbi:uncharacterized protein LOC111640066 [Centruroides sculpturatus]|uniref:uncharacterized protein LOC111640066 n=1 Tax=Centruroides sculpturatus TaxID=218467 RepID=UPI000C6D5D0C|nr:uncharacterized protein LOC111640066 [Centruroides sculpturatus]